MSLYAVQISLGEMKTIYTLQSRQVLAKMKTDITLPKNKMSRLTVPSGKMSAGVHKTAVAPLALNSYLSLPCRPRSFFLSFPSESPATFQILLAATEV